MDEATVILLEDRVLKAVERLRVLQEECGRLSAELDDARARLKRIESDTWARAVAAAEAAWSERVGQAAQALREAIRELRQGERTTP